MEKRVKIAVIVIAVIIALLVIFLLIKAPYWGADTPYKNISSCMPLNQSDSVYYLMQDVSSNETCFSISADNITLDCQGHIINYSASDTGYGLISTYNLTSIKNCILAEASNTTGNKYAVYL